jgi:predicted secreted hydrolase
VLRRPLLLVLLVIAGCETGADRASPPGPSTGLRYLGGEADQRLARATVPRDFVFPEDHGSHPEYRTEWWYFTGNLATEEGRHFGFELTFFRYALGTTLERDAARSAWRTDQIWMAHFAITDTEQRRFHAAERFAREALGLAGARAAPLQVWVKDWTARSTSGSEDLALRLEASDAGVALALDVTAALAPVAHGDNGLDRKGSVEGNASYYYSVPRLAAAGSITLDEQTFSVSGSAWLDREWSTSSLEPGIVGWDWFALQFSDGRSLMFYRLRTADGQASPFSSGSLISADGSRTALLSSDVTLVATDHWTSEATGARYPIGWRLTLPRENLTLDIEPYLENQELDLSVRYWEGAVQATGRGAGGALTAQGYLELAGY